MRIILLDREGEEHILEAVEGWRVMEILRDYGFMKGECGGACACATCHVYVDPAWQNRLHPMRGEEEEMLDLAIGTEEASRLSCQIIMDESLDGLRLTLAPDGE